MAILLANGADIEARDGVTVSTPLHWAGSSGSPRAIGLLLTNGASLEARDSDQATPLHHASVRNSADTVDQLLKQGAYTAAEDRNGETPLHWAARHQTDPMVSELLLQYGADPSVRGSNGTTPRALARQFRPILNDMMNRE